MGSEDTKTGADVFVEALEDYGVTHFFGNPGTTELPLMRSLADSSMQYVLSLHEDIAVGMASGYASTRRYHSHHDPSINPLGVVNLHVAPGMAHGLGNLQNAYSSGSPMLVTAGNHSRSLQHEEPILSGDLVKMVEPYTKWSAEIEDRSAVPTMVRRAVRVALTPPTRPVFLGLPMDVMMAEAADGPERLGGIPSAGRGDPAAIEDAAASLAAAEDPVLVLGDHVARSGPDAIEAAVDLAEASGAAVYSEMITAEISYPMDHDHWVTFVPPDAESGRALLDGDVVAFVGCSTNTPYIPYEGDLLPDGTTCIDVNDDAWEIGKNRTADVSVVGDNGLVMRELADRVTAADASPDPDATRRRLDERADTARELVYVEDEPSSDDAITKAALVDAMEAAAADALVVNESNTSKFALMSRWDFRPEQLFALKHGGLGQGLPAAVGAAMAETEYGSDREVYGFIGDGSYLYYPQTMYTAARYDVDVTVVVPNNRSYRILKDGMLEIYGGTDEDYEYVGMDFRPDEVDFEANAESHGVEGLTVDDRADLEGAIQRAVESDDPTVVDVSVED